MTAVLMAIESGVSLEEGVERWLWGGVRLFNEGKNLWPFLGWKRLGENTIAKLCADILVFCVVSNEKRTKGY